MRRNKEAAGTKTHTHTHMLTTMIWHHHFMRIQWQVENELERSYFVSVKTNDRNFTHIIYQVISPTHFNLLYAIERLDELLCNQNVVNLQPTITVILIAENFHSHINIVLNVFSRSFSAINSKCIAHLLLIFIETFVGFLQSNHNHLVHVTINNQ